MSRPPRPESARPLRADLTPRPDGGGLDYVPLDFADLVELAARIGGALPADAHDPTATLYELSALVAHVLAVHQDHVASESFLATASTARSLIKHGRRLGYEPDPGATATGYLAITAKAGLAGELPAGLVVATAPSGGVPAQDFETTAARPIAAAWNRLEVRARDREQVRTIPATTTRLRLAGTGHGLRAGEPAILTGPGHWQPLAIAVVAEEDGDTVLELSTPLGVALGGADDPAGYVVRGRPAVEARLFGWSADPALFPPGELEAREEYVAPPSPYTSSTTPTHGYQITSPDGAATAATTELFLATAVGERLAGHVLVVRAAGSAVVEVGGAAADQVDAAVRFVRGGTREVVTAVHPTTGVVSTTWVLDERATAGTVTRLRARAKSGAAATRASVGVHARLIGAWRTAATVVGREPSEITLGPDQDLFVEGRCGALAAGMLVALSTRDGAHAQVVELSMISELADTELTDPERAHGVTRLRYRPRSPTPIRADGSPHVWRLGDVVVLANVVPIAHGRMREEVVGESDGVTPFQRHALGRAPLAYLASGDGVTPDLEVSVGGVRWERVTDLGVPTAGELAPDVAARAGLRHYKLEREADGTTWLRFGDGRTSAVPPAGRDNLRARYRVGLGPAGNVVPGRVTRLLKSHPLVDRVDNPTATTGGAAPAAAEDVRRQATRHLRTFDRAVSIRDHADLALLFPGVARATARLADGVIELVAATSEGAPVPNLDLLLDFLDARRDPALRLVPVAPQAVAIALALGVEHDPAFRRRDVEAAIRAALVGGDADAPPGLFTFAARDLGQAAHASEVHARLAKIEGLTFVQLLTFDLAPGAAVRDLLVPHAHQWLRLGADDLTFAALVPSEVTP